jgi:hypothetical protein
MSKDKVIRKRYDRKEPPNDYLKYWRVIKRWVKVKYGLSESELETLLFLYSEQYFGKDKFDEFNQLLSWNKNRFNKLLRDKWIVVWRKREGKKKTLYDLSLKSRRMLANVYDKLNGNEFAESKSKNPMFRNNAPYTDKVYRNYIKEINKSIRQQQRPSQE